jgi:prevent-host-death family protein
MEVSVRELRENLAALLSKAEEGEEITVTRKGKAIVKLTSSKARRGLELDELAAFRKTLNFRPKHNPVLTLRKDERF